MTYKTALTHHQLNNSTKKSTPKQTYRKIEIIDFFPTHRNGAGWYYYHPYHHRMIGPFESHDKARNDFLTIPNISDRGRS